MQQIVEQRRSESTGNEKFLRCVWQLNGKALAFKEKQAAATRVTGFDESNRERQDAVRTFLLASRMLLSQGAKGRGRSCFSEKSCVPNGTNLRRKSPSVRGLRDESHRITC